MSLFHSFRDVSLFRHINREIISRVICEEVIYYKIATGETKTNVYGEASPATGRFYYQGVLLNLLKIVTDQTTSDNDTGPDAAQLAEFRFLRDDLIDINLVPETGDILMWKNNYWEVDNINENQILGGQYPEYSLSDVTSQSGASWSIILYTHQTRPTKLNLTEDRL